MVGAVLSVAVLLTDAEDPIRAAIDLYRDVAGYEATVKSSGGGSSEVMHYYFRKPGFVRMEFMTPFNGAVLVYSPVTGQARLWPFGYKRFPALSLSPENRLIRSSTGQRVDRSDVGALYDNVKALQEHGKTEIAGVESVDGRETIRVTVAADAGYSIGAVAHYQLWIDRVSGFPLRVMSYGADGRLIESVEMEDLKINPDFPPGLFDQ